MVIFDYKYRGGFERHVNISYLLCSAGGDINRLHKGAEKVITVVTTAWTISFN